MLRGSFPYTERRAVCPEASLPSHFRDPDLHCNTPALRTLAPHASAGVASRSEADVAGGARERSAAQVSVAEKRSLRVTLWWFWLIH